MTGFKNEKMAEDIRREISGLISERIKDPRVNDGLLSVVRVDLSGDGSHCKVYVSHIRGAEFTQKAVEGLESAAWMIRRETANKLHLKKCPEFHFIADDSIEHSAYISKVIDEVMSRETDGGEEEESEQ